VVKCVYDGNDIYKGGSLEKAPSIVCIGSDGYDLKGNLKKDEVFGISQFRGMHTRHDAHCIMPSFCDKADRLNIQDLALIIMENII
jgi:predicted AlkP superfamily phosphohydrolase/phosphomutase